MQKVLKMLSEYNSLANSDMFGILKKLDKDLLVKDIGVYYKSIMGILNHLAASDILWLQRIRHMYKIYKSLDNDLVAIKVMSIDHEISADIDDICDKIKCIDGLFMELLENDLGENDFYEYLNYQNIKGESVSKKIGIILLHIFNHHTHHRGEISACLDILKIENDYSNLIYKNLT